MPGTSDKELARSQLVGGERKAAAVSAQRAVEAAPGDAQAWTLLESFQAEAKQRPRLCVAGCSLDGALGAHGGCLALAANELGARQLLVRRARHQLGSPPFQP